MVFVNSKNWVWFCYFKCTAVFVVRDIFSVVFKCNYLFNCGLEFKDMVLREIFGGKMEKLTGGLRELQWALREWDLWCR